MQIHNLEERLRASAAEKLTTKWRTYFEWPDLSHDVVVQQAMPALANIFVLFTPLQLRMGSPKAPVLYFSFDCSMFLV